MVRVLRVCTGTISSRGCATDPQEPVPRRSQPSHTYLAKFPFSNVGPGTRLTDPHPPSFYSSSFLKLWILRSLATSTIWRYAEDEAKRGILATMDGV